MQKRFVAWAVLAAVMLGSSTVCGLLLSGVIRPRQPDYNKMWGGGRIAPAPAIRVDVANRQTTNFATPTSPNAQDAGNLLAVIQSVCNVQGYTRPADWVQLFDTNRMAEEEVPLGFYQFYQQQPTQPAINTATENIRLDLEEMAARRSPTLPAGAPEIVRVGFSPDRQEALVIAKHTATNDRGRKTVQYLRWWMTRQSGPWRVYDFDFSNTRLRFLTVRDYLPDPAGNGEASLEQRAFLRYLDAVRWLEIADTGTDPAGAYLAGWNEPLDAVPMPKYVQGARGAAQARVLALRGNLALAREYLDFASSQMPNAVYLMHARAVVFNVTTNFTDARAQLKAFRDWVGDDPLAVLEDAKLKAAEANDPPAAIPVLRKGLATFPGNRSLLMELARRVPAAEREAVGELIAKTGNPTLLQDAAALFEPQSPAVLDALCTGYRRVEPTDVSAQARAVSAKVAVGQLQAAGDLLKNVPAADRPSVVEGLIAKAMLSTSPTDFYAVLAAADEGGALIARMVPGYADLLLFVNPKPFDHKKRVANLKALLAAHREKSPADPYLNCGDALALAADGNWAAADAELAKGYAKLPKPTRTERTPNPFLGPDGRPDPTGYERFRALRTYFLFKLDKWKQAYADLPPAVDTFDHLANLMLTERDEFKLTELCDLHAKAFPDDVEVLAWRGEAQYLKKNDAEAVKLFKEYRDKSGRDARQKYRADERLIRAYVRMSRPADARAILDEAAEQIPVSPLMVALVAAAEGDEDRVLQYFDEARGFNATAFYADPDLGPLLRKPAFDRVRQKYPPPVR